MNIIEMKVPAIGESITEVTLSQWLVPDGAYVKIDQPICEFESDKATLEFPAEASGKLIHVAAENDDLEIGALVAKIDTTVQEGGENQDHTKETNDKSDVKRDKTVSESSPQNVSVGSTHEDHYAKGHPSPAASKILREKEIDPVTVQGTGKDGRITREDAIKAEKRSEVDVDKPLDESVAKMKNESRSTQSFSRSIRREKMSRMRRTIASRLVSAKNNTAMLTTFNEADLYEVMEFRKKYQDRFVEKHGIKLGFMSIFAKACAKVLIEMPEVNAMIDGNDLVYHDYVDISIAISTPNGLVVPPVHNVESMDFHEIEYTIKELADKARKGTLTLEEMKGGTFTITNGGIFGSMLSTPIINEPQSAILGMHNIVERPVVIGGHVVVRPMMYLALSYDHRVIDGSSSVTFLVKVKKLLEDPVALLLDL
ncbi:MAG TPA: 2-oxoglutarate dehydrogenase complex dihydrolipoyllysine-residue succinyltransferase [Saprospiraceae bacterium]|nr:2-oxoglutarate dehydrogenase complex dihydrolipoyllysine-residue succinyltransferase [Saprospiraceae bacterium]